MLGALKAKTDYPRVQIGALLFVQRPRRATDIEFVNIRRWESKTLYSHLEEAHRFAELVMPLLPLAANAEKKQRTVNTGPFGETIGGDRRPSK